MEENVEATKKDMILNMLFKRLLHFFPLFFTLGWGFGIYKFITTHELCYFFYSLMWPYLIPLLCYRMMIFIYPIKEGGAYIGVNEKKFSPWLVSLRIQQVYIVFPQLERLLFFLPGMYATWLKLWGSKIGKNVFFVPNIVIHDRGLLELGDNIVFGDKCYLSSHFLEVKSGRFFSYVKKIKIESNVFIGAMTHMGPGTHIKSNQKIATGTIFTVNQSAGHSLLK